MDKRPCLRCERPIDPFARICPFCNWDQDLPVPKQNPLAATIAHEEELDHRAKARRQRRKRVLFIAGIVALLIATFAIGSVVARMGRKPHTPEEDTPGAISQRPAQSANQLTDLRLVSVDLTTTVGGSITSAPGQGVPEGAMASDPPDATALPSAQYAELVRRSARQQVPVASGADTLDPRTIVAPPIPQIRRPAPPAPAPPAPAQSREPASEQREASPMRDDDDSVRSTRPEPISQPLPTLDVEGTARFRLRVGADGRVKEVEVLQSIQGATPRLISSIQQWRFKPATENGRPVEGFHLVDVSFKARNDR